MNKVIIDIYNELSVLDKAYQDNQVRLAKDISIEYDMEKSMQYKYIIIEKEIKILKSHIQSSTINIQQLAKDYYSMYNKLHQKLVNSQKELLKCRDQYFDKGSGQLVAINAGNFDKVLEIYIKHIEREINYHRSIFMNIIGSLDTEDKLSQYLEYIEEEHNTINDDINNIMDTKKNMNEEFLNNESTYFKNKEKLLRKYMFDIFSECDHVSYSYIMKKFSEFYDICDIEKQNYLVEFISCCNLKWIKNIMALGSIINKCDKDGTYPLVAAVYSLDFDIISYIEQKMDYDDVILQYKLVDITFLTKLIECQTPVILGPNVDLNSLGEWYYNNSKQSWCKIYDEECSKIYNKKWAISNWIERRYIWQEYDYRYWILGCLDCYSKPYYDEYLFCPSIIDHNIIVRIICKRLGQVANHVMGRIQTSK